MVVPAVLMLAACKPDASKTGDAKAKGAEPTKAETGLPKEEEKLKTEGIPFDEPLPGTAKAADGKTGDAKGGKTDAKPNMNPVGTWIGPARSVMGVSQVVALFLDVKQDGTYTLRDHMVEVKGKWTAQGTGLTLEPTDSKEETITLELSPTGDKMRAKGSSVVMDDHVLARVPPETVKKAEEEARKALQGQKR